MWGHVPIRTLGCDRPLVVSCGGVWLYKRTPVHDLGEIPHDALGRRLFELASDALVVTDLDGTIRLLNPAAATMLGRPEPELLGGRCGRSSIPTTPRVSRACSSSTPAELSRACRSSVCASCRRAARCAGLRSGPRSIRLPASATSSPATSASVDEADAERLGQAFRDAPTGIAFVGVDGTFRRVNAALARLLGETEEAAQPAAPPREFAADRKAAEQWAERGWEEGTPRSFELEARLLRADGRTVVALVNGTLVDDLSGARSITSARSRTSPSASRRSTRWPRTRPSSPRPSRSRVWEAGRGRSRRTA